MGDASSRLVACVALTPGRLQKLDPGEFVTVGEVALGDQPAGRFVPAVGWELPGLAYALD